VDALVLWALSTDSVVGIARQMYELGMTGLIVYNNGAVTIPETRERMDPEWYDGWYCGSQWNPYSTDAASVQFNKDFEEAYGALPSHQPPPEVGA
jgi:hypothetical protein